MNDDIRALVEKALLAGKKEDEIIFALRSAGMGEEYVPQLEEYFKKKRQADSTDFASASAIRPSVSESLSSEYVPAGFSQANLAQQQKAIANAAAAEVYSGVISSRGNIGAVASDPAFEESYRIFRSLSDDPAASLLPQKLVENGNVNEIAIPALKHGAILYANDYLKKEQERQKELGAKYTVPVLSELAAGFEQGIGGVLKLTEALGGRTGELADFFIDDSAERVRDALIDYGLTEEEISKGFIENLSEGNFGAGLTILGSTLIQQAPQLVVAAAAGPYGLAALGTSAAGSQYAEIENRSDLTANEKMLYSVGVGAVEYLTEKLFLGDIKMLRKAFAKSGVDKMSRKELGDVLFGALPAGVRAVTEEGVEEVIASAAQQTIGKFMAGDEIDPIEIVEGGIIGGLMGGGAYLASRGAGAISRQADRKKKSEAEAFIKSVDEKLADPEISVREKDILRTKKEEAQGILRDIQAANDRIALSMSAEDLEKINGLRNELRKGAATYKTLKTDEAKAAERQRITAIAEQITEIQNKYDSEEEARVPSPVVEGEAPVEAKPVEVPSAEAPEAGRVLQVPAEEAEITTVFNAESPIPMAIGLDVMYKNPITEETQAGELAQDGQRVIFRNEAGEEFDIGNVEDLADVKPEEVGLTIGQEIMAPQIAVNTDGSLTYNGEDQAQVKKGTRLRINQELGTQAIKRRKKEGYKVEVMDPSGKMVSLTGPAAEEAAYQIVLATAQSAEGRAQIDQLIQQDETAQRALQAAVAANEQRKKQRRRPARPAARPAEKGPEAVAKEPTRERVKEEAPAAKESATPREKMIKAVEDGKAFLKKSLKEVSIVTHDTRADFDKAMNEVSRGKASAPNVVDRGRFIRNTKTGKLEVHINLEQAREADVAHEIFHATFYKFFGQSEKTAKQFATDLAKVLNTGNKFERGLAQQLDEFIKKGGYTKAEAAEEIIAEAAGLLYQNSGKITTSMLDKIALFLNKIAEKLKLDPLFTGTRNRAKIVELLNSFASAMSEQTGIDVTKTSEQKSFTEVASKIAEKSSRERIWEKEDGDTARLILQSGYIIHSSKNKFDVFDPNLIVRTAYGFGFYFTGQAEIAQAYGQYYTFAYANAFKMVNGKDPVSERDVKAIINAAETANEKILAKEIERIYGDPDVRDRRANTYNRLNGIPVDVLNQKLIKEAIARGVDPEEAFTIVSAEGKIIEIPTSLEAERQLSALLVKAGIDGMYKLVEERYLRNGNEYDVVVIYNYEKLNNNILSYDDIIGGHLENSWRIDYDIERSSRTELPSYAAKKINKAYSELDIKEGSAFRYLGSGYFGFATYVEDLSEPHPNGLVIKGTTSENEANIALILVAKYNGELDSIARHYKWAPNTIVDRENVSPIKLGTKALITKEYLPVKAQVVGKDGEVIDVSVEDIYKAAELLMIGMSRASRKDMKAIDTGNLYLMENLNSFGDLVALSSEGSYYEEDIQEQEAFIKIWNKLIANEDALAAAATAAVEYEFEDQEASIEFFSNIYKNIPPSVFDNLLKSILSAKRSGYRLGIELLDQHEGNYGFVVDKDGITDGSVKLFDVDARIGASDIVRILKEEKIKNELTFEIADGLKNVVRIGPSEFSEMVNVGTNQFLYEDRMATYIPANLPKPTAAEVNFGHGNVEDAYDVKEKASKEAPKTKADKLIDAILNDHWGAIQDGYDVGFGNGMFGTGIYGVGLDGPEHIAEFSMKTSEFDGEDIVVLDNFASVEGMIGGKRKGNGRRALRGILRLADEYGVRVKLLASPITMFKDASKATKEKLIKFYASEGFEPMKGGSVGQMIRPVGAQPQKEKPLPLNNERYWGKDTADVTTLEEFIKREEDFDPNYVGEFSQEELDNLPPSIISDMFFDGYNEDYGNIESFEKRGKNDSWAIVSPQNRGDKETTPEQNEKALKDAESWFKENDLSPNKVYTMFNGLKRVSFFVPNMSVKQVREFNGQFEQINSLHSSGIVSQVPMNNSSRLTIEDEYGDPHGVWTVPTDIGYDDNYIVAKKWDGEIAYFKPQYDDGDAVFESEMDMDTPPEDRSSKEVIQSLESGRFEITEDGKGNYVFFHYSPEKIDTVDPKFFGKNAYTSDRRITPISFYYTAPNRQETMVSGDPNVVLVKKEEVYPFTTDPLNLYDEAKKLHDEYYGKIFKGIKKAFDAPSQATWIMRVAADRGYKMLIAAWNDVSRAETPLPMKVDKAATAEFIKSGRKRIYAGEDLRTIGMVDRSSRQVEDMRDRIKKREEKSLYSRIKDAIFWNPEQKQVRRLKESMTGQMTIEAKNIRKYLYELGQLLKKSKPEARDYVSMIFDDMMYPEAYERLNALPNGKQIAEKATAMRAYIDSLSKTLLNDPAFVSLDAELKRVIRDNIGSYVRASYRFWKSKSFNVSDGARADAIQYEYEVLLANRIAILSRSGYTDSEINSYLTEEVKQELLTQATGIIDRYITEIERVRKGPKFKATGLVRPSSIKLPSQQFMKRKDLSATIEALLGKETDPLVRFVDTTTALSNIKYKGIMISNMLEQLGPDVIKNDADITKTEEESGQFRQIKDEYSPLNGKWVRADLFEILTEEPLYQSDFAPLQLYFNILKIARKSKVVYNIPTWRKNITGGWYTMLANGVFYNQNMLEDLANRFKQLSGSAFGKDALSDEVNESLKIMGEYGLLGTSVDANMVGLMDITMTAAVTGQDLDSKAKTLFDKFIGKGKSIDKWATENYSFIDDYTKLIIFRQEVEATAMKLYGKKYSSLSESELKEVHLFAAERVKQNTPTFSRLPRFYRTLAKLPFGDFLSFELEAIRSIYQNVTNGLLDVKKGMSDTGLSSVQKKAYINDGMKRLLGVSSLMALRLAITAGLASFLLGDDEDLDEDAKAVRPDWMNGHSVVVTNISKTGEVTAYDYSLEDPYGNVFDVITNPAGVFTHAWELFGPNMAVEFISNIVKGKDVYGRDIAENTDDIMNSAFKYTSYGIKYLFVPPAISSYYRDYIKGGSAEKPKDYFTALIARSTIRDYKYNVGAQFYFSAKELATGKNDFDQLDDSGKRVRMRQLEEIKRQYEAVVNIGLAKGNYELVGKANSTINRNFSALEKAYILYGYKPR